MTDRTAIDTIKGYFYQFDYSILRLLETPNDSDIIVVEGIEDVDIKTANEDTAVQCKYYAKTEYNHSVISKPIRQMLDHFGEFKSGAKPAVKYHLYGHFKDGHSKLSLPVDVKFLKEKFLSYTSKGISYKHHEILNLNDTELDEFLSKLSLDINALSYEDQLDKILITIETLFSCDRFDAENLVYNNALKHIKDISVENDLTKRQIVKKEFVEKIDTKSIMFNEWFVEFRGRKKHFTELRKKHFSTLNISPFERFFLIEVGANDIRSEIKDVVMTISKKWSKLSQREKSPFCPYVYLHGISDSELIALKQELFSEGFKFLDGYDYHGATFSKESISQKVNFQNGIKAKIINNVSELELVLAEVSKTKEVYQFFASKRIYDKVSISVKNIEIQVKELSNIKEII